MDNKRLSEKNEYLEEIIEELRDEIAQLKKKQAFEDSLPLDPWYAPSGTYKLSEL